MTYKTLNLSYTMEKPIEDRVDWEIARGVWSPLGGYLGKPSEEPSLTQGHLEDMLKPLDSIDCFVFLIMTTMDIDQDRPSRATKWGTTRAPFSYEIDKMLDLPKGSAYSRYRRAVRVVYDQYRTIMYDVMEQAFMNLFISVHVENVLNDIFENGNKEYVL